MVQQASPFPYTRRNYIDSAIKELKRRSVQSFRHGIKREDLQVMLTRPEDRPILQRAAEIMAVGFYNYAHHFTVPHGEYTDVQVYLEIPSSGPKILLPNYANKEGFQPDLPDEVRTRVHGAIERMVKNDMDWRYVAAVVDALMNRCRTASQIKLFMPTIVTLFRTKLGEDYPVDDDYADRIYGQSIPKDVPALPPELKQCATDVGMTITRASMLPFAPEVKAAEDDFIFRATVKDDLTTPWGSKLIGL